MAKPLGPKALVIRQAIAAHPDKGNTELAELINDSADRLDDKIKVKAADVAAQKQAMKKGGATVAPAAPAPAPAPAAPAAASATVRPAGKKPTPAAALAVPRAAAVATVSPVDVVERVFDLAQQCGGFEQLRRLVDRLAGVGN